MQQGITLPTVEYKVVAEVKQQEVFNGMVLPIPRVLIYFLRHYELMLVATILEESIANGECSLTVKELSIRLKISTPSISASLYELRRRGLLLERNNGRRGNGRTRILNYKTIQHLNDLVEGEDPGIYCRIRNASKKIEINNLTKQDVNMAFDNNILPTGHDPAEEEEYN